MSISIFTTDANLIVRSWDPRLAEMTGVSGESAYGLNLSAIVPDFEKRGLKGRFERVLSEGVVDTLSPTLHHYLIPCEPPHPSEYFEQMQQRVTIAPLRNKEQIVGTIVTIEDVTERRDRERRQAERLARVQSNSKQTRTQNDRDDSEIHMGQLTQVLQEQSWQVRREAVESLSNANNANITAQLLELLRKQHRNPSILNSVLQVLSVQRIDPIPALIECLKEPDVDLRIYATLALGEREDYRAIPALIETLEDEDANVRYHAIEALGILGSLSPPPQEAIERLIQIAESGDFFLAFPALDALMRIGDASIVPRLLPLLKNTLSWRVRREAVDNLARQSDSQVMGELLRMLREQHRNPNVLNSVLQVLVLSNVDPIPSLIECLKEGDADLRIYAALALGERLDPRATVPLIECLLDVDTNVRYHAIEALGRLRAVEAVEPLVSLVQSGDFFLAFPAMDALMRIGDRSIAPSLIPLLENQLLATQAAEALCELGDADTIVPMVRLFNSDRTSIGEIAVAVAAIYQRYERVFGEGTYIADVTRSVISPIGKQNLLAALESASTKELQALTLILGWLEGEQVERALVELLDRPQVREAALEAVVRYGSRVSPLLVSQLEAVDLETRRAAAIALGRIGNTGAVEALSSLLNAESELVMVVAAALAQIGDRSSFEALLELLGHPDVAVRLSAIAALNSLGHPALPERIFTLLMDDNPWVRESAVKIAGYFAFDNCIDRLFQCCDDPVERVRRSAIEHLPYLETPQRAMNRLVATISRDSPQVRAAAARALGDMEFERNGMASGVARDRANSANNNARDTEADGSVVLDCLLEALKDEDSWVRYYALSSIAKLVSREEVEVSPPSRPFDSGNGHELDEDVTLQGQDFLFQVLQQLALADPANPVRARATEALGCIGQERAVRILADLAEVDDGDGEVARSAIAALGRIAHPDALAPLLNALNSPHAERRLDALQAFKERGGSQAQVALQWIAAADPETRVVRSAIDSLARMASPEAISSLLELTVDPTCRDTCVMALASVGGTGVEASRETSQGVLLPGNVLLERYIDSVAAGLQHVHASVRSATVEVLARLKHPYASEQLIAALDDDERTVRLAALNALNHLGNRAGEEKIASLARTDPDTGVRRAAQKVLQA